MRDPDFTGAILTFLFIFFVPFLVSLFGRMIFIFATFAFCCLTLVACVWAIGRPHPINILLLGGPWIGAWICAIVGIRTKSAARVRRAIGKLYVARVGEVHRESLRGKNRAWS